jgi:2'-5' RNA ligase
MNQRADCQRLFFALWPEPAPLKALAELRTTLRPRVPGHWLSPSRYHVTLAFLGSVAGARMPDVIAMADRILSPGFCLEIDRWVWWPGSRVLALVPRSPPLELLHLAQGLAAGLARIGFAPEQRDFRPHLTMARHVRLNPGALPLARAVALQFEQFCLVASRLSPAGSRYEILQSWPLQQMMPAIPPNQGL